MCGIVGIVSATPEHFRYTDAQLRAIEHRGPDEKGAWKGPQVFLGSRRLSIIDLAHGTQPIFNEDRTCCIVYNGELYNFLDLRPELERQGHQFATRTDTEVVLHAYEEWGLDCLRRFNGMFAFAIWDGRSQELVLARDRLGEKPLYYFLAGDRLVFASEIKAILADPTVPREINPRGLVNYLAFSHAMAPDTMYRGILKLQPGHYLRHSRGTSKTAAFWDVGDEPQTIGANEFTEDALADRIMTLLDDAVRRRMVADVPVGAFLSGGVDSSAVVAMMQRHATAPVKTFSLGFQIGGAYDELADASRVARFLGTEHYELRVDHLDIVETLQRLVYAYDEPFGDAASFPVYLISQFAREHVKVVLAGEGGDELFGGYRRFVADQYAHLYQLLPGLLLDNVQPIIRRFPRLRRTKRILSTMAVRDPGLRTARWLEVFTPEMRHEILRPVWEELAGSYDPTRTYREYYEREPVDGYSFDHLNRMMYVDLKTWLPDAYMEKVDKATMAVSLEGRLPILDHRLVELAFQIPSSMKIRRRSTKRIFKRAVAGLLPPEVLSKPKHGFAVPTDPWFRGELRDFVFEVLFDEQTRRRGFFDPVAVQKLYNEHTQGREVHDTALWLLLIFELWCRAYLDMKPTATLESSGHSLNESQSG